MKKFLISSLGFIQALLLLQSCTSSSSGTPTADYADNISITANGTPINLTQVSLTKDHHSLYLVAKSADNSRTFRASFNDLGQLGNINCTFPEVSPFTFDTHQYLGANTFSFQVQQIDLANHWISVQFQGKVYRDLTNLNSQQYTIQGQFGWHFTDNDQPNYSFWQCKIDGNSWLNSNYKWPQSNPNNSYLFMNDGAVAFKLSNDPTHLQVGSYNLSDSTQSNRVLYCRYDSNTDNFINYTTTAGQLQITSKAFIQSSGTNQVYLLQGTFSLEVQHPSNPADNHYITQGSFARVVYE